MLSRQLKQANSHEEINKLLWLEILLLKNEIKKQINIINNVIKNLKNLSNSRSKNYYYKENSQEINIKIGKSNINLNKEGQIEIKCQTFTINADNETSIRSNKINLN